MSEGKGGTEDGSSINNSETHCEGNNYRPWGSNKMIGYPHQIPSASIRSSGSGRLDNGRAHLGDDNAYWVDWTSLSMEGESHHMQQEIMTVH